MEKTTLEHSIREEARRSIEAVREREIAEMARLDEQHAAEVAEHRTRIESEGKQRKEWELSRIANRGILEQRKLRLRTMENLVEESSDRVLKDIAGDSRYRPFVIRFILAVMEQVASKARIGLRKGDLSLGSEIEQALRTSGRSNFFVLEEDPSIIRGGATVEDCEGGRVFNGTVERIYFRKLSIIRREVMEALKKHGFTE